MRRPAALVAAQWSARDLLAARPGPEGGHDAAWGLAYRLTFWIIFLDYQ